MATKTQKRESVSEEHTPRPKKQPRRAAPKIERPFKRVPLSVQDYLEGLTAIGRAIPPELRENIPTDLSKNVDHYLYGVPKDGA